jgi:hypothetical protein
MRTLLQLNFVTSNYLNFVLDVVPECALNGGKDRLCVNDRPQRGLVKMKASSSDLRPEKFSQDHGVACG